MAAGADCAGLEVDRWFASILVRSEAVEADADVGIGRRLAHEMAVRARGNIGSKASNGQFGYFGARLESGRAGEATRAGNRLADAGKSRIQTTLGTESNPPN